MGLIPGELPLTVIDPGLEAQRTRTHPGQAHFAGTGPAGKFCRECVFWTGCGHGDGYYAKNGKHGGILKPRSCEKYRSHMQGEVGPGVPHNAMACRYFEQAATMPSITQAST